MPSIRLLAAFGAPLALLLPASAGAAQLEVVAHDLCLDNNKTYQVGARGFTPGSPVGLSGMTVPREVRANPHGSVGDLWRTPNETSFTPRKITLGAQQLDHPEISASLVVYVVRFGSNAPVEGKPSEIVTWRFAGFPGKTIYGHFRYRGKTIRDYRFGKAQGVCGTLQARAPRLPAQRRRGTWTLQIDGRPHFKSTTIPAFKGSFVVR